MRGLFANRLPRIVRMTILGQELVNLSKRRLRPARASARPAEALAPIEAILPTTDCHSFRSLILTTGAEHIVRQGTPIIILVLTAAVCVADGLGISEQVLDKVSDQYGRRARAWATLWRNLVDEGQSPPTQQKLAAVNDFFNRSRFRIGPRALATR